MAKKRLNKNHRALILKWMFDEKLNTAIFEKKISGKIKNLAELINPIIREKYPEKDMIVLRKYNMVRKDTCLKFVTPVSRQVFGVSFRNLSGSFKDYIHDVPNTGGCYNQTVFEGTQKIQKQFEIIKNEYDRYNKTRASKIANYRSFINACVSLEDVEASIKLPLNIVREIKKGTTALLAINKEIINDIKNDFNN